VIGGGLPVGAFGGRTAIMECIAPLGPVYQAGTLSGNPIAMAAGCATLNILSQTRFYDCLANQTAKLMQGLTTIAEKHGIPFTTNQVHSMFGLFFTEEKNMTHFKQVKNCDIERFKKFFHGMLSKGVYLAPSAFEAGFMSIKHDNAAIEKTLDAADYVMQTL
jgi:glutamate-1-semialdehyde 2,1-aminomutase